MDEGRAGKRKKKQPNNQNQTKRKTKTNKQKNTIEAVFLKGPKRKVAGIKD